MDNFADSFPSALPIAAVLIAPEERISAANRAAGTILGDGSLGRLEPQSTSGQGSRFTVILPLGG